jgi:hypothetical protein
VKASPLTLITSIGVIALMGFTRTASADDGVVVKDQVQTTGPNQTLLHSGIWIFVLSYVPAVIVAAESSRSGDKNLYIPVAGPWMDLATRGACAPNVACNNETVNRVLIVVDGVFQGLAALDFVGAFVFPETRTVTTSSSERAQLRLSSPSIRVLPVQVGARAYGLAAVGTF